MITNKQAGTNVHEIAEGIYRINTPLPPSEVPPHGFSFNQYLIRDEAPLLFHTGLRKMFPLVKEAVAAILPPESLRYIAFSHYEADECGAMNEWLATAPQCTAVCSSIAALVSVEDVADRPPKAMNEGEILELGTHKLQWFDAPHLPHAWECGYMFEKHTSTMLSGDLFTQPGTGEKPLTDNDILEPSEAFRKGMDYYSHSIHAPALLEKLASANPTTLACMHGSAWQGNGAALLRQLARTLGPV